MNFNPDISKEAQEVTCSCEIKKPSYLMLIFNNNQVAQPSYQKRT